MSVCKTLKRTTLSEGGLISAKLWVSVSGEKQYPVTLTKQIKSAPLLLHS